MSDPWKPALLAALLIALSAPIIMRGCSRYGTVSSEGYEFATALYSICNRRDEAALSKFHALLTEARQAERIAENEARWLQAIADQAGSGDWQGASRRVRQLMSDQIVPAVRQ